MSDLPNPADGGEELDLGEVEDEGAEPGPDEVEDEDRGEPGPDEVDEGEPRGEAAGQQRAGRKTQTQRLRERIERQNSEVADLRRQMQALQQQPRQPQLDPAAQAAAEAAKWERRAMLSPAELVREVQEEARQEFRQALQFQNLQMQDVVDKRDYDAQARTSRLHQQYRERVESTLAAERARGNLGITREVILKYLVGEDAMQRAERAAPRQRQAAATARATQQARPTGARGDGAVARRQPGADDLNAVRARIAGKPLW